MVSFPRLDVLSGLHKLKLQYVYGYFSRLGHMTNRPVLFHSFYEQKPKPCTDQVTKDKKEKIQKQVLGNPVPFDDYPFKIII